MRPAALLPLLWAAAGADDAGQRLRALAAAYRGKACRSTLVRPSEESERFEKAATKAAVVESLIDEACGFAEWMVEYRLGLPLLVEVGPGKDTQTLDRALARGCRVLAVEPSRGGADHIRRFIAAHDTAGDRITLREAAAAAAAARVPFHEARVYDPHGHDGLAGGAGVWWGGAEDDYLVRDVDAVALNDVLRDEAVVLVLLIEAHGWELQALEGAAQLIDTHRVQNVVFRLWPEGLRAAHGGALPGDAVKALMHRLHRRGYYLYQTGVRAAGGRVTEPDLDGIQAPRCIDDLLEFLDKTRDIDPLGLWVDVVAVKG